MSPNDPHRGPGFDAARMKAFRRSGGLCVLCGQFPACDAHHWAPSKKDYPDNWEVRAKDLTPLCQGCHVDVTLKRRWLNHQRESRSTAALDGLYGDIEAPTDGSDSVVLALRDCVQTLIRMVE